jgi:hypothetical protein
MWNDTEFPPKYCAIVVRVRLPAAPPTAIAVESRINLNPRVSSVELPLETLAITKTFDEVEKGVIVALNPVTSVNDVLVLVKVSVFIVDTTCKMPCVFTGSQSVVYFSTASVSFRYVTIPSDGEGIAEPRAAESSNTITVASLRSFMFAAVRISPAVKTCLGIIFSH